MSSPIDFESPKDFVLPLAWSTLGDPHPHFPGNLSFRHTSNSMLNAHAHNCVRNIGMIKIYHIQFIQGIHDIHDTHDIHDIDDIQNICDT